jgi:hypothetical protein
LRCGGRIRQRAGRYNSISVRCLVIALAFAVAASQPDTQTGASRVALATVLDLRNRPLLDVSADDFVVQEAGATREVLSARPADYPIVLVIDTAQSSTDFELLQKAASHFLERIGQRPVAIVTCGAVPRIVSSFEEDRSVLVQHITELTVEDSEPSPLRGAAMAGDLIRQTGTLFSAIVLVSASGADSAAATTAEALAPVVDSNAMLHVVSNQGAAAGGPASAGTRAIRALADQTRGEYAAVYSAASYQAALDHLAERLTSELMIEYLVPVGSKPNDVKIGVRLVGARVRGLGVAPK